MAGVQELPGPFSFLGGAGQAIGAIAQQREEMRRQHQMEARQAATVLISMRERGLIGPEAFSDPNVQQIFSDAGFGVSPSAEPTSADRLESLKQRYLTAVNAPPTTATIPGGAVGGIDTQIKVPATAGFTPEQRSLINAPQPSQILGEQVAARTAAAQLPEAGATATAGTQSEQDKTFNSIADRVVDSIYTKNKRLPTPQEAALVGRHDARASVFGDRINEQYYGAAIERLRAKLEEEKTRRVAAQARASTATPINLRLLKEVNDMVAQADAKLKDLDDPVKRALATAKDSRIVERLQQQRDALQTAASELAGGVADENRVRALMQVAGQALAGGGPVTPTGLGPDQVNRAAEIALRQKDPEAALEAEVKAGRMTAKDKAAILKRMQEIAK